MNKIINSLVLIIIFFVFYSCSHTDTRPLVQQRFLLGTPLVIKLFDGGSEELMNRVFERIEEIEKTMSSSEKDYDSTEILDINKASLGHEPHSAGSYAISEDTEKVLEEALRIAELTQGAFDPTIQPLVSLWGFGKGVEQHVPDQGDIERIKQRVDWKELTLDTKNHRVGLKAMQGIDVGGIAKGYSADLAKEILSEGGVRRAIIDFGGNIVLVGTKDQDQAWVVGLQEPYQSVGTVLLALSVTHEASIVTSGVYERFFEEDGKKYSHLIDGSTGYPVENSLLSVTIITQRSMEADALSTGVFVMGLEKGVKLINRLDGVEAIFVTKDQHIIISQGLSTSQIQIKNTNYVLKDTF